MAVMHVECVCVWALVRELIFLLEYGYVQAKKTLLFANCSEDVG